MGLVESDGIAYELLYNGGPFTMLRVILPAGASLKAQSGAMVSMSSTIDVESSLEGGLLSGLARKFLTGERFFFQTLTATRGPGEVMLSPDILGDLIAIKLDGSVAYKVQKGGFFAASEGVQLGTKMQGLGKGLFSGEGFFVQDVSGQGTLFVESFGAVHTIDIPAGEERIIDNHHLVAWPSECNYRLQKASTGLLVAVTK